MMPTTGAGSKKTIFSFIHNFVCSIDVVEIMDLVLGLFKISKMEEDMDKIVACVQVQCFILQKCLQYYNNQKMILFWMSWRLLYLSFNYSIDARRYSSSMPEVVASIFI